MTMSKIHINPIPSQIIGLKRKDVYLLTHSAKATSAIRKRRKDAIKMKTAAGLLNSITSNTKVSQRESLQEPNVFERGVEIMKSSTVHDVNVRQTSTACLQRLL